VGARRSAARQPAGGRRRLLLRGRGWALYQAVSALAYYWDTNPGMIRQGSHALMEVLADTSPD
jgi:hypothetical protein